MNSNKNFEFPFIGAGEARYFEWAEVHIQFKRMPSQDEKENIRKDVPLPLQKIGL